MNKLNKETVRAIAHPPTGGALLEKIAAGQKKMEPHPLAAGGALLDTAAAAAFLGCSPWSLCEWRVTGDGPRFVRVGRLVRYTPAALAEWIDRNTCNSTSDVPKEA